MCFATESRFCQKEWWVRLLQIHDCSLAIRIAPLAAVAEAADPARSNRVRIEPKVRVETRYSLPRATSTDS